MRGRRREAKGLRSTHNSPPSATKTEKRIFGGHPRAPGRGPRPSALPLYEKRGLDMFYHLGKLATRFRWLIVGMWMVAIAASLPFAPQAGSVLHPGGFVSPDAESERAINLLVQKLHLNLTVVEVFFTSQKYSADSPQFIQETHQALAKVRSWSQVSGIVSFTDNPRQIAVDRQAAYVNVMFKPDPDTAAKLLPELEHLLRPVPDLKTSIGGVPIGGCLDFASISRRRSRCCIAGVDLWAGTYHNPLHFCA